MVDKEFLLEIMEKNELIESTNDKEALESILENIKNDVSLFLLKFQSSLSKENILECQNIIIKLNYLTKIEQVVKEKLFSIKLSKI